MLVEAILDQVQSYLHDDGTVWTRGELLNWLNDGYRQMLAESHACVRPFQMDVPGRTAFAGTQEWEERHSAGHYRRFAKSTRSERLASSFQWEAEMVDGLTPTTSLNAVTQAWEVAYIHDNLNDHFQFVVSKAHERPLRVFWDNKQLAGASHRELDLRDTSWHNQTGEPLFWFPAIGGKPQTYEIFEITTSYNQGYHLGQAEEGGMPRLHEGARSYAVDSAVDRWDYSYSGGGDGAVLAGLGFRFTRSITLSRAINNFSTFQWEEQVVVGDTTFTDAVPVYTHAWESQYDSTITQRYVGVGLPRSYRSEDRQYLPSPYESGEIQLVGTPRDYKSSEDSLTMFEIVVPTRALTESDSPSMIPLRFAKYLKYYVLAKAFLRKGEGMRPDLSEAFQILYTLGVRLLTKLGNPTFLDKVYVRDEVVPAQSARPPRVRLPSTFERAW